MLPVETAPKTKPDAWPRSSAPLGLTTAADRNVNNYNHAQRIDLQRNQTRKGSLRLPQFLARIEASGKPYLLLLWSHYRVMVPVIVTKCCPAKLWNSNTNPVKLQQSSFSVLLRFPVKHSCSQSDFYT